MVCSLALGFQLILKIKRFFNIVWQVVRAYLAIRFREGWGEKIRARKALSLVDPD